ncbi:MAG: hypothetical protein CM15mP55_2380 [Hyphomicrobiales bacterium]|nr:MAG: hypothetical protein CM15mP55_2380 [Hyphomicrobiales bacterium]
MSDLDWNLSGDDALAGFSKGQTVEAVVLDVDMDKERVSLGVKQLDGDPFESLGDLRRGSTVTCEVTAVTDGGLKSAWVTQMCRPLSAAATCRATAKTSAPSALMSATSSTPW